MFRKAVFFVFFHICFLIVTNQIQARTFIHPGISHKLSDLERMKYMVATGKEPWATSFSNLQANPYALMSYTPKWSPDSTRVVENWSSNYNKLRDDATAAYFNAVEWYITGDSRFADKVIQILNNMKNIRSIVSATESLCAGRYAGKLCEAAEIIKNTYSGWAQADIDAFKAMLVYPGYSTTVDHSADAEHSFYWAIFNGDYGRHGNQGLFGLHGVLSIAVCTDNEIMYDRVIRYLKGQNHRSDDLPYPSGLPVRGNLATSTRYADSYVLKSPFTTNTVSDYGYNEQIQHYIWENGQSQEASRDQVHSILGVGLINSICEIAWNQGDDIYSWLNYRPLLGLEYYFRYNLSYLYTFPDQTTAWEPTVESGEFIQKWDRSSRWYSKMINPYQEGDNIDDVAFFTRGDIIIENDDYGTRAPIYEMTLGHYRDRLNLSQGKIKWLSRADSISRMLHGYEQYGNRTIGMLGYGGLTFHRADSCAGDPVSFSTGKPVYNMHILPATIQAEDFDYMPASAQGRSVYELSGTKIANSYRPDSIVTVSTCSTGGYMVTDLVAGEWLNYTIQVPTAGAYQLKANYHASASGGKIRVTFEGIDKTGEVSLPVTGVDVWSDIILKDKVILEPGVQSLRIFVSGASNVIDLNSISFVQNNDVFIAVNTGNWSSGTTWNKGTVPTATDEVIIPYGYKVTVDASASTCKNLIVQFGGELIMSNSLYVSNIEINSGGKFYASTGFSSNKSLFWGAQYASGAYTPLTGDFKITVNGTGQLGGTVAGTNDGIAIYFGEYATSYTIDGTSTGINYIGRLMANNSKDQTTLSNLNLDIKQNLFISLNTGALGFSLQNNKKFVGSRTLTIYPGYNVTTNSNVRFHANAGAPTADQGNFTYNIYGTLDLAANSSNFDVYTTSFSGNTQNVTVNVGNGTDNALLKLGRNVTFRKYYSGQSITMNWVRPNSKIIFGGNGAITITSQSYNTTSAAYIDDASLFPDTITNLSYENLSTSAALTFPRKVRIGTFTSYGYGNKFYAGSVIDATAKYATVGRLFSYNNNAYVVTSATATPTQVSNTTLGGLTTWVKGTTVQDAAGNSYYCDSVGLSVNNIVFPSATSATAEEFTGGPVLVYGMVTSNLASGYTARFSAAVYVNGNLSNSGAGTVYFARNSTVGGTFTNNGTITLTGDIVTGDLINNGTFTLGTKMLTLNGSISGNNIDASTGSVQYGGTTDRTISGFTGNVFNSLRLNTTGTITLGGATKATGLTLTKGKLALGEYDLAPTTLSGGSSTAYVITNGTGKLTLTTVDATAKTFPVGISSGSYDLVKVTPTTGTTTSVKVSSVLSGSPVLGVKYNAREWDVTPSVASSTELAFSPSVLDPTVATKSISPVIGHYQSGSYINSSATYDDATKTYSGTFETFSPFVTGANINITSLDNLNCLKYKVINHQLIVEGLRSGEEITVFSLSGQIVFRQKTVGCQVIINIKPGIYILKANAVTRKVAL